MNYVEGKSPPPEYLELAWQCESFHALPVSGGILDQPHNIMLNMKAAMNVYTAWSEWKKCPKKNIGKWMQQNPKLWAICDSIIKSRKNGR